jgi:site-specific DNA recombinase
VPHPNPVKREQGMHKTRLVPDPEKARVVLTVFQWRVGERLSYGDIAERLNARLDLYPPKKSNRPDLQRTSWSKSSVRELLENPKYTGYMVWNRRASKTGAGRVNHPRDWVWSPMPTHEPLVTMELFKAARAVAPTKEKSRSSHGINRHPLARRTYLLRSYVVCSYCDHRMHGKFRRRGGTYFACEPKINHGSEARLRFPGHPKGVWVREDALTEGVLRFFAERVYGPQRREFLSAEFDKCGLQGRKSAVKKIEALKKAIADLDRRRTRLVEQLESLDDPDGAFLREVQGRHRKLTAERDEKLNRLAELAEAVPGAEPATDLLDRILMADVERLRQSPEPMLRQVFDAFRLRVVYDGRTGTANCRVTITDESLATIDRATRAALAAAGWGSGHEPAADDATGSDGTTTGPRRPRGAAGRRAWCLFPF